MLLRLNDLAMSLAYQQRFRQNMINLSRGSQPARSPLVIGNFSSDPATLISLSQPASVARHLAGKVSGELIGT